MDKSFFSVSKNDLAIMACAFSLLGAVVFSMYGPTTEASKNLCGTPISESDSFIASDRCVIKLIEGRCNPGDVCIVKCIVKKSRKGAGTDCLGECLDWESFDDWEAPRGVDDCLDL